MLELLGNDLTARGRQSPADILTVKSPISPPRCRLFTSAMAPSTHGWRQSTSLPRRFAPRCRPGCWKSNRPLPARRAMLRPHAGPRQPRRQGKNVISYTSDLPVQRNAHIMRSHLLSQSLTKACVALISHTTLKTMKLSTLLAAAFAIVGFCNTASAVTYPCQPMAAVWLVRIRSLPFRMIINSRWNTSRRNIRWGFPTCWKPTRGGYLPAEGR